MCLLLLEAFFLFFCLLNLRFLSFFLFSLLINFPSGVAPMMPALFPLFTTKCFEYQNQPMNQSKEILFIFYIQEFQFQILSHSCFLLSFSVFFWNERTCVSISILCTRAACMYFTSFLFLFQPVF